MKDAGLQPTEVGADKIKLHLVKRACAGRGAKVDLAARIFPMPGDAGGKIEQLGYRLPV